MVKNCQLEDYMVPTTLREPETAIDYPEISWWDWIPKNTTSDKGEKILRVKVEPMFSSSQGTQFLSQQFVPTIHFQVRPVSFRVSLQGYTISSQQFLPAWDVVSTIFARIMLRTSSKSNGAEGNNDLTEEPWNPGCFCWGCFIQLVVSIQLNLIDIP